MPRSAPIRGERVTLRFTSDELTRYRIEASNAGRMLSEHLRLQLEEKSLAEAVSPVAILIARLEEKLLRLAERSDDENPSATVREISRAVDQIPERVWVATVRNISWKGNGR